MKEKTNYENMKENDLKKVEQELDEELRTARFNRVLGNATNVKLPKQARKKLARVKTILHQIKLSKNK